MAASAAKTWKLRLTKDIRLNIRLKQARSISVLSTSLVSCAGVFSKDKVLYRGHFLTNLCVAPRCKTLSTKMDTGYRLLEKISHRQSHNCQTFSFRRITTSALYLNGKNSISTGKRKLKEKIEKVKEMVRIVVCTCHKCRILEALHLFCFFILSIFHTVKFNSQGPILPGLHYATLEGVRL